MKKNKFFLFVIVIGIVIWKCNIPISEVGIEGVYVNNNYNEKPFYAEIPYNRDTLKLTRNKTFFSNFYGEGTYEFSSNIFGGNLYIVTENSISNFPLQNKIFRQTRVILVSDLNFYYEKVIEGEI